MSSASDRLAFKRLFDVVVGIYQAPDPTFQAVVDATQDVCEWTATEAEMRVCQAIEEGVVTAVFDDNCDCHLSITEDQRAFVAKRWS